MRTVGLVTEYNPFHNGHLYHLNKAKEITKSDYSVVVMSGNFVQRGEPALLDKWTRAKMAIDNGADLVIEIPTIYSVQSAEFFAYGAVKLIDSIGIVNSMVFGSEAGELDVMEKIADVLAKEPVSFKNHLKNHLSTGKPFPVARSKALMQYLEDNLLIANKNLEKILSSPNNILAIEYLKALKKIKSPIKPYTLKRIGADYNDTELKGKISSATSIRKVMLSNGELPKINDAIPFYTLKHISNFIDKYKTFNSLDNYTEVLLYLLRTIDRHQLTKILDIEKGLENRIIECGKKNNEIDKILDCINTKRYTYTRLQRILIHILLGIDRKTFLRLHRYGPLYLRILGFNEKGIQLLNKAKKVSKIPIITKFSNYKKFKNNLLDKMISFDIKGSDIYFLGLKKYNGQKANLDFFTTPYIKK